MQKSNPDMYFEFQLDLRTLNLSKKHYQGSVAIDASNTGEMEKIRQQVLSDLSYVALTHLTQLLGKEFNEQYA
jgi:hypothetical protein